MESTHISERYRSWFPESSFDAIARRFPVNLAEHRKRTVVSQTTLTDTAGEILDVYFKAYASRANAIDGCARKSRAVCEARNLGRFHAWGIRSAEVVACGYRRRLMGLCADQSFIITRAIPQGQPLQDWWTGLETPLSQELRRKLITELGMQTRALHAQGFYHQDLKWRNVLVDREHQLWWIDCPSGHYGRFPWRHVHG